MISYAGLVAALAVSGAFVATHFARTWLGAALLAVVGAFVAVVGGETFLFFRFGFVRNAFQYIDLGVMTVLYALLTFPIYGYRRWHRGNRERAQQARAARRTGSTQ